MKEWKGTKGECVTSGKTANFPKSIIIRHVVNDGVNPPFELDLCHVLPKIRKGQQEANAELIVDAFNTMNKCGIMPSELLEQRNQLIDVCKEICNSDTSFKLQEARKKAHDLISKFIGKSKETTPNTY